MSQQLATAKRIVIKVGSALLVDNDTGTIQQAWFNSLIADVVKCWQEGKEVILVSSGAVALGRKFLKNTNPQLQLEQKQAAAAIGQIQLAHAYQEALAKNQIIVAQVLLTLDDSENRRRYLNAKNTLESLLTSRIIPVINENDTVATAEIRYGDNDRLAARVSQMVSADVLILLSDIDGLYTADPRQNPQAKFIPEVKELTSEILAMAGNSGSIYGSGGMITKLAAAKIALASGCKMVIALGKPQNPIMQIDKVGRNTWFIPKTTPISARKNWIAQHLKPLGALSIDDGAEAALRQGKSLLAAGMVSLTGEFQKGDCVCILNSGQQEIGRGLVNYPAREVRKLIGHKSSEFADILGYPGCEAVVHRDDLVLHEKLN
ncbi:MAG TPA: glutamate 5-kinase [Gammaproteobacteria bacterium]|nr:glutamate 5-kinase [Gammaproteobacteria bacterium]